MIKRLPSLTALRTFEAAARHKSFSKAGEELAVTPAAVGFQIKQLEEEIGTQLFVRKHRAVELTPTGRSFGKKLSPAFQDISAAWQELHVPVFKSPLRISPDAESKLLFNSPGTQIYRERSRCFLYVAVNALNPYLCQFVVEASAWLHDGSYFSRENCEVLVSEGKPFNFSLSFDRKQVLTEMG